MNENTNYCASVRVHPEILETHPDYWQVIKQDLISHYLRDYFPKMIGDGLNHVMKFDFAKLEHPAPDFGMTWGDVEYRLYCRHSVAQVQQVVIAEISEVMRRDNAVPVCSYCGNVLNLDMRGGCRACGAPGGKPTYR